MDWDLILTSIKLTIFKSPLYITWLVGIVLIVVYSERHGKNMRFFLIIVLGFFIVDFIGIIFNSSFRKIMQSEIDLKMIGYIIGGVNFILILSESILWGLLIYLFITKTRPKTETRN